MKYDWWNIISLEMSFEIWLKVCDVNWDVILEVWYHLWYDWWSIRLFEMWFRMSLEFWLVEYNFTFNVIFVEYGFIYHEIYGVRYHLRCGWSTRMSPLEMPLVECDIILKHDWWSIMLLAICDWWSMSLEMIIGV